jgi:HK97 gp10 family phage protein
MAQTFMLVGLDETIKQLRKAPTEARRFLSVAVRDTEYALANKTRAAAPRGTGALRHAISSTSSGLNARIVIERGMLYGQEPSRYWRFVEFGTSRMAAQPFIRPQAESEQDPFIHRVKVAGHKLEQSLKI